MALTGLTRRPRLGHSWFLCLLLLTSCSTGRVFLHPSADLEYYERVGVVPFRTLANDRMAGMKMTIAFTTELLVGQMFEVAEPGAFREVLQTELDPGRREATELTPEELKVVGEAAGVQGIFEGTVSDFEMTRIGQGSYPIITLEVRLLDAATGEAVWATSVTQQGGPKVPIFGWGEIATLGELADRVAREAVGRLPW